MDERLFRIAEALLEKTRSGEIRWKATEDEDTFETPFADYTVVIMRVPSLSQSQKYAYRFTLIDKEGRTLDSITLSFTGEIWESPEYNGREFVETFRCLFEIARKTALNVDEAIGDLLKRLTGT